MRRVSSTLTLCRAGAGLAILIALSPGCYRHVVRAEGVGTSGVDVYEPNHKPGPIERLIEPKKESKYKSPYGGW